MTTVRVCYTTTTPPLACPLPISDGSNARGETITVPSDGSSTAGNLSAQENEHVVEVIADGDCWIAVGTAPDASAASDGTRVAHPIASGVPAYFWVSTGESVAAGD